MNRDLLKRIKEIQTHFESELGHKMSEDTWSELQCKWFPQGLQNDENITDFAGLLDETLENARKIQFIVVNTTNSNHALENSTGLPKTYYKKSLEKRFYMVNWVTNHRQGKRLDWKRLTLEWNKKHPYDPMTPVTFNVEYHRSKKDKVVQQEYAKRNKRESIPQIEEFASHTQDSLLAQERLWEELGRIALYQGKDALASTLIVMRDRPKSRVYVEKGKYTEIKWWLELEPEVKAWEEEYADQCDHLSELSAIMTNCRHWGRWYLDNTEPLRLVTEDIRPGFGKHKPSGGGLYNIELSRIGPSGEANRQSNYTWQKHMSQKGWIGKQGLADLERAIKELNDLKQQEEAKK